MTELWASLLLLAWHRQRSPFDHPLGFVTLISVAVLFVLWAFYTHDYESMHCAFAFAHDAIGEITEVLAQLNDNASSEKQLQLLERLYYLTIGIVNPDILVFFKTLQRALPTTAADRSAAERVA